jgi:hypothetical protein
LNRDPELENKALVRARIELKGYPPNSGRGSRFDAPLGTPAYGGGVYSPGPRPMRRDFRIRGAIPPGSNSPPAEVFGVIETALCAHFAREIEA